MRNVGKLRSPTRPVFDRQATDASWHIHSNELRNKAIPVAVVIGADPSIGYVSFRKCPIRWMDFAVAGARRGEPVELVPCETIPIGG
jgi:UbiD family decarboxylase